MTIREAYESMAEEDKNEFWHLFGEITIRRGSGHNDLRMMSMNDKVNDIAKFIHEKTGVMMWQLT